MLENILVNQKLVKEYSLTENSNILGIIPRNIFSRYRCLTNFSSRYTWPIMKRCWLFFSIMDPTFRQKFMCITGLASFQTSRHPWSIKV